MFAGCGGCLDLPKNLSYDVKLHSEHLVNRVLLANSLTGVNIFCVISILRQENNQTVEKMALAFSTSFIMGVVEGSQA